MESYNSTSVSPSLWRPRLRAASFASISCLALATSWASGASAQVERQDSAQEAAIAAPPPSDVPDIVVTASRVTRSGFTAPTPTTVVSDVDIQRAGQATVFDYLATLPGLNGNTTTATYGTGQSAATGGVSALNLRGLGTNRTLALLDGQRIVGALSTGVVDAQALPQGLIKRVDVVTGGASASWGSDAVAGVINYVLDHNFTGFKAEVSAGQTNYKDDKQFGVTLTAGTPFASGRGHFEISGEYHNNEGVPQGNGGRTWDDQTKILQRSIAGTPAGAPQYIVAPNVSYYQMQPGGVIIGGPLQNIAFGPGGAPYNIVIGSPSAAPYASGGTVSNLASNANLDAPLRRKTIYARLSFDVTPDVNVWTTFNYGAVHTSAHSFPGFYKPGNITIQCDNAFLPASISTACATNNITSFRLGTWNKDFPDIVGINDRNQTRYAAGADGRLDLFGKSWDWHAYAAHGQTSIENQLINEPLNNLYSLAIDAVRGPNGTIVCRSALTAGNTGCVPLNVIGTEVANPQAISAILGTAWLKTKLRQKSASVSFSGEPLSNWAGPISLAGGVDWREESIRQAADIYSTGNGGNPLLNAAGNNWFTGNFHPFAGRYHVLEGFLETVVPVVDSEALGKANLTLAARFTDYSTSGYVTTWKIGGSWDTPFAGIRLRGTRSRDIRAPNLSELFTAAQSFTGQVAVAGQTFNVFQTSTGNRNLKPEVANTTNAGIVWQPKFLPGFSASFDYYRINLKGAIGSITAQQEVDLCVQGDQSLCSLITFNAANQPTALTLAPVNLASIKTNGFDIEASYRSSLSRFMNIPGAIDLRVLATHVSDYTVRSGILNAPDQQMVGNYGGTVSPIAAWRVQASQTYSNDSWSFTFSQRYVSPGVINTLYVECTTNCPLPTINNPTINDNHVDGAFLLDIGGSYNIKRSSGTTLGQLFFKINNLTNVDPPKIPQGGGLAFLARAYSPALIDSLGRVYRVGFRVSF